MENVIFRFFKIAFRAAGILLLAGVMTSVLSDAQKRAIKSKQIGLTSMLRINEQLVGK